jgi:hypothetical protein
MVGHKRGHANPEVHVEAVTQFLRDSPRDPFPFLLVRQRHWKFTVSSSNFTVKSKKPV